MKFRELVGISALYFIGVSLWYSLTTTIAPELWTMPATRAEDWIERCFFGVFGVFLTFLFVRADRKRGR